MIKMYDMQPNVNCIFLVALASFFCGCVTGNNASKNANVSATTVLAVCGEKDSTGKAQAIVANFFDDNFTPEELDCLQRVFADAEFSDAYTQLCTFGDAKALEVMRNRVNDLQCAELLQKLGDCAPQLNERFDEEINIAIDTIKERDDTIVQELESLRNAQSEYDEEFRARFDITSGVN